MHPRGAEVLKCVHPEFAHVHTEIREMVHKPGAQLFKSCTRHKNHVHRVQDAPLISNTVQ